MLTKQSPKSPYKPRSPGYVICINNDGYEVSLEARKLYEVLSDPDAQKLNQLRIIDESGEDYLHPAQYFATIKLPQPVRKAVRLSSRGHR